MIDRQHARRPSTSPDQGRDLTVPESQLGTTGESTPISAKDTAARHDPEGLELAMKIAHQLSGSMPPPRLGPSKKEQRRQALRKRRPKGPFDELRSGPSPDFRDPQALGSAMEQLVTQRGWQKQLGLRVIIGRWAQLVGPTNAAHTCPESYRNQILVVRAESSTWASALRLLAPQLVAELNHRLGDGSVLRVDVRGPAAPSWKHGLRSVNGRGPRDTYG